MVGTLCKNFENVIQGIKLCRCTKCKIHPIVACLPVQRILPESFQALLFDLTWKTLSMLSGKQFVVQTRHHRNMMCPWWQKGEVSIKPTCLARLSASRCLVRIKSIRESPEWDLKVAPWEADQLFKAMSWKSWRRQEKAMPCHHVQVQTGVHSMFWSLAFQPACWCWEVNNWSQREHYLSDASIWLACREPPRYSTGIDRHQRYQWVWRQCEVCSAKVYQVQ